MVKCKTSYKNNKLKMSASTWNGEFEIPDGLYSVSDIEDYFEYIFKKIWDSSGQSFNNHIRKK